VNTTSVPNNTTLYYTIIGVSGTITTSDFSTAILSGSFVINNNVGNFSRGISADAFTEGTESFQLQVRTVSTSGTIVAVSATITINDTSLTPPPPQVVFTSSGSWVVPSNVTSISMVTVGGGGGGRYGTISRGGGGGSTSFRNAVTVTPGETLTITVGAGGAAVLNNTGSAGGQTRINQGSTIICQGNGALSGGGSGQPTTTITGVVSSLGGPGGSTGTASGGTGGGGAGGYTAPAPNPAATGGTGGSTNTSASGAGANGAGGGGGGTASGTGRIGGKGGGVGLLGRGPFGDAVARVNATLGTTGNNGSGGSYGAGGAGGNVTTLNAGRMNGNAGGVRIIWGQGRSYPNAAADA
jgi:hypothetical protein